ncbi:TetR/AcrR family transcriptional regulator [Romboutsia sedimentorum]|uniref:TetR/AcrR family transcriptional regulator n=1 Tax=Romboutsia sedimentorum TaxID=1368474 RepID=A0ABT7E5H7_9FIRM|nr:TetR/AcrR family transcriptional regulator [Romboutsia sedimentorum]MDK2562166.1 TetR/AcrR family transcriptional regulator [Romboutsia sedimentorum]
MDIKQELIMNVAQKCFNSYGIKYTSIDDIVKECKISKSTFYKCFSTKENLVGEMLNYSSNKFLNQSTLIDEDNQKTPKEKLKLKIKIILDYLESNRYFNLHILGSFSEINGKPVEEIKSTIKSRLVKVYYDSLIEVYGKEIKPFIWELIFVIDSVIHEFDLIKRLNKKYMDEDYIFEITLRQVELNIENLKHNKYMITENILYTVEEDNESKKNNDLHESFLETTKDIKAKIENDNLNKKLNEAILEVEQEYNFKNYNSLMMDAMIAYLEKEQALKIEIDKLKSIKLQLGDDSVDRQ